MVRLGPAALLSLAAALAAPSDEGSFVGWITDTECGPNHAPMIAKGGMGSDDAECTRICVKKGATYGFVDLERKRFYQLDDQDAPGPFAGGRVRITGRLQGDTIYVTRIEPAKAADP
jgi:hypothetical protein